MKDVEEHVEKELVEPVEKVNEVNGNRPIEAQEVNEEEIDQAAKRIQVPKPIEEVVRPIIVAKPFEANQPPVSYFHTLFSFNRLTCYSTRLD